MKKIVIKYPKSINEGDLVGNTIKCDVKLPQGAHPEVSPNLVEIKDRKYMMTTTAHSMLLPFEQNKTFGDIFNGNSSGTLCFISEDSWLISDDCKGWGYSHTGGELLRPEVFNEDRAWEEGSPYWKRSYFGIYDTRIVSVDGKDYVFCIFHGENKNEKFNGGKDKYMNNVLPKRSYMEHEFSGVDAKGAYDDYGPAYFAFASSACIPTDEIEKGFRFDDPKYNYGPVVWPCNGYVDSSWSRINPGMRHSNMYLEGDYIYIFYLDQSSVKVARSPISAKMAPGSFKRCSNGEFCAPALPEGFECTKRGFFTVGSGECDNILGESNSIFFSVARLKGTPYYLGVEEYYTEWPEAGARLRLSTDLVHWSGGVDVPGSFVHNYNAGTLHYPKLFNKDFSSRDEIDPDEFYIVGIYGNNIGQSRIEAAKFSIELCD